MEEVDEIYFTTFPVGCNKLRLIINHLIFDFLALKEKFLFNKIGQGVNIIHIEEALAPCEYGMEVIGHHDPISYGKSIFALKLFFGCFCFHIYQFTS
jgi:hypothetical protein